MALVEVKIDKRVAVVRLNRPEKRNALNGELIGELTEAFDSLHDNDDVRCVVSVGTGNSYSAGLDLYYLRTTHEGPPPAWDRPTSKMSQLVSKIRLHPKVTIACINGYCLGGGLAILNAHDLAFASETAEIGMPEVIRGSFGQLATSTLFHSGIPLKKAFWIQLTGHNITGREAEQLGLVSKAVRPEELMDFTLKMAHEIAGHEAPVLAHAKIAAYFGYDLRFDEAVRIDHLVGERMARINDPFKNLQGYLASQQGGTKPSYSREE